MKQIDGKDRRITFDVKLRDQINHEIEAICPYYYRPKKEFGP